MKEMDNNRIPRTTVTEPIVEMARLAGLSDGVFAFALTLLVLDVRLPEGVLESSLLPSLQGLLPRLLVYIFSFVVIGGAWGSHQRMLGQIVRGDGPLVWFNLLLLFFVTLLPACSALLGRFPFLLASILIFGLDVILIQLAGFLLWRHARLHGLVNVALDPRVVSGIGRRMSISALLFAVSVPLYLLGPAVVFTAWTAIAVLLFTSDWLSWHQAARSREWSLPLAGVSAATVTLKHGAGQLLVRRGSPDTSLLEGTFGGGVEAMTTRAADHLDLRLQIPQKRGFMSFRYPWAWGPANALDWIVRLSPSIPVSLVIQSSGGQLELDLTGLAIRAIRIEASASSVRLVLPQAAGEVPVSVTASVSSLAIRVPKGSPARIKSSRSLRNSDIDEVEFPPIQEDHEYASAAFASASDRFDISLDVGWGSAQVTAGRAVPGEDGAIVS
jgi:uncharacterized membrane protein